VQCLAIPSDGRATSRPTSPKPCRLSQRRRRSSSPSSQESLSPSSVAVLRSQRFRSASTLGGGGFDRDPDTAASTTGVVRVPSISQLSQADDSYEYCVERRTCNGEPFDRRRNSNNHDGGNDRLNDSHVVGGIVRNAPGRQRMDDSAALDSSNGVRRTSVSERRRETASVAWGDVEQSGGGGGGTTSVAIPRRRAVDASDLRSCALVQTHMKALKITGPGNRYAY